MAGDRMLAILLFGLFLFFLRLFLLDFLQLFFHRRLLLRLIITAC